jgi:hypothetical protein
MVNLYSTACGNGIQIQLKPKYIMGFLSPQALSGNWQKLINSGENTGQLLALADCPLGKRLSYPLCRRLVDLKAILGTLYKTKISYL